MVVNLVERWVVLNKLPSDVLGISTVSRCSSATCFSSDDERHKQPLIYQNNEHQSSWLDLVWTTDKTFITMRDQQQGNNGGRDNKASLVTDSGDELYLQLDIGLLPIELRTAFFKTFLDDKRIPKHQNSKLDMWVPIAPRLSADLAGLWVPRIEGEALRKWLSTGRLQEEGKRGITIPCPYTVYEDGEEEKRSKCKNR